MYAFSFKGRSQTTKGIWMARCAGIKPCMLVMDLEGTYGRERGEVGISESGIDDAVKNLVARGKYDSGNRDSNSSQRSQSWNPRAEEEFYGLGNFLRDVEITIGSYIYSLIETSCDQTSITISLYYKFYPGKGMSLMSQLSFIFHFMCGLSSDDFVITGDFFKDLQEEFKNWEASAASQGKPKSLWEELSVINPLWP